MNRFGIRYAVGFVAMVFIVLASSVLFKYSFPAWAQLTLGTTIVLAVIVIVLLIFYVTPEPGEVLVVFGDRPKVLRGSGLKAPWHRAISVSLMPTRIEVKREVSKPLISLDGLPVSIYAIAVIAVRNDEASILAAARNFRGPYDARIQNLLQTVLAGTVAEVVADINYSNLRAQFSGNIREPSSFEAYGYELRRMQLEEVTQLSAEETLYGVDLFRARARLAEIEALEKQRENNARIEMLKAEERPKQEQAAIKAREQQQETNTRIETLKAEERLKQEQAAIKAREQQRENDAKIDRIKADELLEQEQAAIEARKRQRENNAKIEEANESIETFKAEERLSKQRAETLVQEAETEKLNQELRRVAALGAAETERQVKACTEKALLEIEVERKNADLEIDKERVKLRGEELALNRENQDGNLDFLLKKQAIQAAENASKEQAKALAAALGSTKFTFLGDAAAASDLAKEYVRSIALASRISEILSILNDVGVQKAVAGTVQLIQEAATGMKPSKEREAHGPVGGQGVERDDRDSHFEPL